MCMKRMYLLKLARSKIFSRKTIHSFLQKDPSFEIISSFSTKKIAKHFNISYDIATKMINTINDDKLTALLQREEKQYNIITVFDSYYPALLKQIVDAPLVLYTIGNYSLLNKKLIISVIGTRKPSKEAWHKVNYIMTPLVKKNWVIVSGLAKGIDSYAHQLTLNEHGETIAVLGHGFNYVYPKENYGLLELIKNRGLVITEYPPNTPPRKHQFPERNRIISGLSLATLVIEAKKRSGTLITVNQALEQGRDVYALPDSPLLPEAKGCLELIQDGAKLIMSANDILSEWKEFMS